MAGNKGNNDGRGVRARDAAQMRRAAVSSKAVSGRNGGQKAAGSRRTSGTLASGGRNASGRGSASAGRGSKSTKLTSGTASGSRKRNAAADREEYLRDSAGSTRRAAEGEDYERDSAASRDLTDEIIIIVTLLISVLLVLSFFGLCGSVGQLLDGVIFGLFGSFGYAFPFALFFIVIFCLSNKHNRNIVSKGLFCFGMLIFTAAIVQMAAGGYDPDIKIGEYYTHSAPEYDGDLPTYGGFFGGLICRLLVPYVGSIAAVCIMAAAVIVFFLLTAGKAIFTSLTRKGIDRARAGHMRRLQDDAEEDYDPEDRGYDEEDERDEAREEELLPEHTGSLRRGGKVRKAERMSAADRQAEDEYLDSLGELGPVKDRRSGSGFIEKLMRKGMGMSDSIIDDTPEYREMMDDGADPAGQESREIQADTMNGPDSSKGADDIASSELNKKFGGTGGLEIPEFIERARINPAGGHKTYMVDEEPEIPYFSDRESPEEKAARKLDSGLVRTTTITELRTFGRDDYNGTGFTHEERADAAADAGTGPEADRSAQGRPAVRALDEEDRDRRIVSLSDRRKSSFTETDAAQEDKYGRGSEGQNYGQTAGDEETGAGDDDASLAAGRASYGGDGTDYDKAADGDVAGSGKAADGDGAGSGKAAGGDGAGSGKAAGNMAGSAGSSEIQPSATAEAQIQPYVFPPIDLLSKPSGPAKGVGKDELESVVNKLQSTFESFGVKVRVTDATCGPTVTRYEITPEQGVKVKTITSLADDIKLALAAADIRIEAPIPGKAAVGIEVPNRSTSPVLLRELLESPEFKDAHSKLTFAVGKDIGGKTICFDIASMPHMLIAGATGSGKSVCINALIMSLIYKAKPSEVKMIMIDPKRVELVGYNGLPHLLVPVVTDVKRATGALNWAIAEMDDRYTRFADAGVNNLASFNRKIEEEYYEAGNEGECPNRLPQVVIIIDELNDLMMTANGKEVEAAIVRLTQLARASGIHVVLATQRPSVNVITGTIKANIPSRIAFSVTSIVDSRTILDQAGAEKLLGKGDMLFYPQGYPKPVRLQGAFVSDKEVAGVVDFVKKKCREVKYSELIAKHIDAHSAPDKGQDRSQQGDEDSQAGGDGRDEFYEQAGRYIIEKQKASIGNLQRNYRIGFNRAARIMDALAEDGVVGPEEGTKPRRILMTLEQFDAFLHGDKQETPEDGDNS